MFRIGIIGIGRIGAGLEEDPLRIKPCTHTGGILKNNKLLITSVCDIDKTKLSLFGKRYKVSRLYIDFKKMLKNEVLDALVIATWTDSHKAITCEAARRGVKLIICEKPMAFSRKDCDSMVRTCKQYGSILMINHERRWEEMYRKVKEMITEKKIGEIRTVTANVLTERSFKKKSFRIDKSSLLHDGTHLIDMALFLFGDPESINGFIPRSRKDSAYGIITFRNDIVLFLEAGGDRNFFNFELDILGTDGRIKIGNEYKELWIKKKSRRYKGFRELEKINFPRFSIKNSFIEEYREVVRLLEGKIRKPSSSGEDGMKTIEVIEKLVK